MELWQFRNFLLGDGYHMVQYSVYARVCNGIDSVSVHKARLYQAIPARGAVRMLVITEKQYTGLEILLGQPAVYDNPRQKESLMAF